MTQHLLPSPTGYGRPEAPFAGYLTLMAAYGGLVVAGFGAAGRRTDATRLRARDLALLGTATFKLSRLITRDHVTSVVRAPFVEYQGGAGHGEVEETPRGEGIRRAVGELLVCPYCISLWIRQRLRRRPAPRPAGDPGDRAERWP